MIESLGDPTVLVARDAWLDSSRWRDLVSRHIHGPSDQQYMNCPSVKHGVLLLASFDNRI